MCRVWLACTCVCGLDVVNSVDLICSFVLY